MQDDFVDDTIRVSGRAPLTAPLTPPPSALPSAVPEDLDNTIIVAAPKPVPTLPLLISPEPQPLLWRHGHHSAGRATAHSGANATGVGDAAAAASPTPHYWFRIAETVVELDKTACIGRRPSSPRVVTDGVPRLIQVPSPLRQVSASHIEIRQRGASIVLTDLRSSNGSVVNIPGRPPQKLRRGESLVVIPGTLVDIGDGNLIEILPIHGV